MNFKGSFLIFSTIMLLLVTKGYHSAELMCYVCEHCTTVTAKTPVFACDESFFNGGGTELPSTMTTTTDNAEMTTLDETTIKDTTIIETTTKSTTSATTTTTNSTRTTETATTKGTTEEDPATTEITVRPPPTPSTVAPPGTTTPMPTPPTQGTVMPVIEIVTQSIHMYNDTGTAVDNATTTTLHMQHFDTANGNGVPLSPQALPVHPRQRRALEKSTPVAAAAGDSWTYHCYSVRFTSNATVNTQRGCSRVTTQEAVCKQLEMSVPKNTTTSKCQFCDTNRCNSSSALGVSFFAMILGLVASSLVKRS